MESCAVCKVGHLVNNLLVAVHVVIQYCRLNLGLQLVSTKHELVWHFTASGYPHPCVLYCFTCSFEYCKDTAYGD